MPMCIILQPSADCQQLSLIPAALFDLLVVGSGITGTGVAREAALRGLSVALVDRADIASGTSSRSSRLVHGGVRYLEHGHVRMVFESSRERRTLLRIAPHLVRPLAFTWPVYRGARLPRWKVTAGLALYDALALFRNVGRHERLNARRLLEREPALLETGLTGGTGYWDASTDDSRLTLANALSAAEHGAEVASYTKVVALLREGSRVVGARVRDTLLGAEREIRARLTVSAVGPWTDSLLRLEDPDSPPLVRGTRGAHLLLPRERVGNSGALTLLAPQDGRVVFILPAGAFTLVGTTDTPTDVPPESVRATSGDVSYLLGVVRHFMPASTVDTGDVVSAWAGIRPLAAAGYDDGPSSASREHRIDNRTPGLLVVTGGKLTTYRSMATEIVDAAANALHMSLPASGTDALPLPGGDGDMTIVRSEAAATIGNPEVTVRLTSAHGTGWRTVWQLVQDEPALGEPIARPLPYIRAEVVHAVRSEWARTLADVLVRRVPVAFETPDHGRDAARSIVMLMARELVWDDVRCRVELERYDADVANLFSIDAT